MEKNRVLSHVKDGVVVLLFLLYFRTAAIWMFHLFTNTPLTSYGFVFVALVIIGFVILGYSFRKNFLENIHYSYSKTAMFGLVMLLSTDLINTFYLRYQIISAAAFLLGGYFLLGFYIDQKLWRRGLFLAIIVTSTLPFIEHIQTFLGFPVRLVTAKIVSALMHWIGASSISDSTIIITENHASVIDLPCSGIKSIYTGVLYICFIYYFQRVDISLRMILVSLAYFATLLFFNVWRVFSLVYIYNVLQMTEIGNNLHIALGIGGFIASSSLAWFLTKSYLSSPQVNTQDTSTKTTFDANKQWLVIAILFSFLLFDTLIIFRRLPSSQNNLSFQRFNFQLEGIALNEIPLTQQERSFFESRNVIFAKKYDGKTLQNMQFTLLLVSSKSWRTHHNPEICLQGMGYQIKRSDLLQLRNTRVRKVTLSKNQGTVLYWFVSNDQIISDYSERVWAGMLYPNQAWTLVEIGFNDDVDTNNQEISDIVRRINQANFTP